VPGLGAVLLSSWPFSFALRTMDIHPFLVGLHGFSGSGGAIGRRRGGGGICFALGDTKYIFYHKTFFFFILEKYRPAVNVNSSGKSKADRIRYRPGLFKKMIINGLGVFIQKIQHYNYNILFATSKKIFKKDKSSDL